MRVLSGRFYARPLNSGSRAGYSQNCKLADSVINSFVRGNRLYRVDAQNRQNMYLYTNVDYADNQRSWGCRPEFSSTRGIVASSCKDLLLFKKISRHIAVHPEPASIIMSPSW